MKTQNPLANPWNFAIHMVEMNRGRAVLETPERPLTINVQEAQMTAEFHIPEVCADVTGREVVA